MRHKHADLIHAWADGAEIEARNYNYGPWHSLKGADCITWDKSCEYRIKPTPKPDVVRYVVMMEQVDREVVVSTSHCKQNVVSGAMWQIKVVRDGETGKLIKAEVL